MQIIDLNSEYIPDFLVCLEEYSEEMKEAGDHKARWTQKMQERGLRVKLALDDNGVCGGMIQYVPIENSFFEGQDLYVIQCSWVHGHKQGRGDCTRQGMGTALLKAAEEDIKKLGAKGIAAWGNIHPFWNPVSWYEKHGYVEVDREGFFALVWKPLTDDAVPPKWVRQKKMTENIPGKVTVTAFLNGWCPASNIVYERARRASAEFGDKVVFQTIDTFDPEAIREWGITDGVFVDGVNVQEGPPPDYQEIFDKIARRVEETIKPRIM